MIYHYKNLFWKNEPKQYSIEEHKIGIKTEENTDLWQKTYYGFCNNNAPMLCFTTDEKFFSFTVKTSFNSSHRFDQCGVCVYQNSNSWLKASIEYEDLNIQRLGSVVTNNGYSDWATTDIPATTKFMYYRLSRRENDFCIENSVDGVNYRQMRIAHLFEGTTSINLGVYACSPEKSSFTATFTEIEMADCKWLTHK